MSKYRKKPVIIDAFQLGVDFIPDWFMDEVTKGTVVIFGKYTSGERRDPFEHPVEVKCNIITLEGTMMGNFKDFIIRGVNGEIYPCKPDIFRMTYEKVEE